MFFVLTARIVLVLSFRYSAHTALIAEYTTVVGAFRGSYDGSIIICRTPKLPSL